MRGRDALGKGAITSHNAPPLSPTQQMNPTRLNDQAIESLTSEAERGEGAVVAYFHNSADKGDSHAHMALGHMYLLGAVRGSA